MPFIVGTAILALSIIALIYLFLISPRMSNGADMELLSGDYAHRGLWTEKYPENSLSAFELAARNGYGIELDVRLSKDKQVVVFHDDTLKRMCGVDKRVDELTLKELKALTLGGTNERIPTFSEVLSLVNGRVPLLVEVKGEMPDPELCDAASRMLDKYNGPFCVECFSPIILNWFKKHRPTYARGQLVTKPDHKGRKYGRIIRFVLPRMLTNFLSRPDFIAIDGNMSHALGFTICTKALKAKGFLWTVRRPNDYIACKKAGYSAIFEKFSPKGIKKI